MRALVLLALAAPALFANGNSATSHAAVRVNIVAPVKLISNVDMNFGTIVVDDMTTGSSVTMLGDAHDYKATMKDWKKCAAYTGSATPTPAIFHYQKDKTLDVNINIDKIVMLGKVKLTTNNDLPADNCTIFDNPAGVESKHFAVAGTLEIPAGIIGQQLGQVNVTVSYK